MGDTGSLAIGGGIAAVAILIKQELVLVIVGGVFVLEAASVLIQQGWFKYTRKRYGAGRRIFRCAPLHHHFEYIAKERAEKEGRPLGAAENMITVRFWIVSIIFALIGVATLKIR
jgi:phospho-N-acetylmuramoyl-pentapeptide-transferase